jgi:RNA polymerase sigma-70 factor (ECF subfamily)
MDAIRGKPYSGRHAAHRVKGATWMVTPLLRTVSAPLEGAFPTDAAVRFEEIYRRYRPLVEGVCRRMLRDRNLAPDIVQDIFVSAFTSMPAFRSGDPVGPWLKTIAKRRCIDQIRRDARLVQERPAGLEIERWAADDMIGGVEDAIDAREALRALEPVLRRLTRRQHRAVLRLADGWTHQEIADELDVQVVAARALVHRARRKVHAALSSEVG